MENKNIYIGHRYVPKIIGEWDINETYEGLSIVTLEGVSYTSKKHVPVGIDISNNEYWVVTGNYNVQVENYRQEVRNLEENLNDKASKNYVDNNILSLKEDLEEDINNNSININNNKDDIDSRGINLRLKYDLIGDGSDETLKMQQALDDNIGKKIFLPRQLYNNYYFKSLDIPSNTHLVLDNDCLIESSDLYEGGSISKSEKLINMSEKNNIIIEANNSIFRLQDKEIYSEEWNHIFYMMGAKNIKIHDAIANDSGGDGFYVGGGQSNVSTHSQNIKLYNCIADNNTRQGISIVSCIGFRAYNCEFNNTIGKAPETGIDIEPSFSTQKIIDIKFINCKAKNNRTDGVRVHLQRMNHNSDNVDVEFINFESIGNTFGYAMRDFEGVKGVITLNNCKSIENSASGYVERGNDVNSVMTVCNDFKSINDESGGHSWNAWQYGGGSSFYFGTEKDDQVIGNSYFNDCISIDNRGEIKTNQSILGFTRHENSHIDKVYFNNFNNNSDDLKLFRTGFTFHEGNVNILFNLNKHKENNYYENTSNNYSTLGYSNIVDLITNRGSSGTITFVLKEGNDLIKYRILNVEGNNLYIWSRDYTILGQESDYLKSSSKGDYIELVGDSEGNYRISKKIGEWLDENI